MPKSKASKNCFAESKPESCSVESPTVEKVASNSSATFSTDKCEFYENSKPKEGQNWVFTWHGFSSEENRYDYFIQENEDEYKKLGSLLEGLPENLCEFYVYDIERCPKTGKLHGQGVLRLKKKKSWIWIQNTLCLPNYMALWKELAKNMEASIEYCTKNETKVAGPYKFGEFKGGRGRRKDCEDVIEELENNGGILTENIKKGNVYRKHGNWCKEMGILYRKKAEKKMLEEQLNGLKLNECQKIVYKRLLEQDDRKITVWVDEKGGRGKSTLADMIEYEKDAFVTENGESKDIVEAYLNHNDGRSKIIILDASRATSKINYALLEQFKNGRIQKVKWNSEAIRIGKRGECKVLLLMNWMPELDTLSLDRWDILKNDDKGDLHEYNVNFLQKK